MNLALAQSSSLRHHQPQQVSNVYQPINRQLLSGNPQTGTSPNFVIPQRPEDRQPRQENDNNSIPIPSPEVQQEPQQNQVPLSAPLRQDPQDENFQPLEVISALQELQLPHAKLLYILTRMYNLQMISETQKLELKCKQHQRILSVLPLQIVCYKSNKDLWSSSQKMKICALCKIYKNSKEDKIANSRWTTCSNAFRSLSCFNRDFSNMQVSKSFPGPFSRMAKAKSLVSNFSRRHFEIKRQPIHDNTNIFQL